MGHAVTRYVWGYLYWFGFWLGVAFLAAELAGFWRVAPWPTLSETVWHSEQASAVVAILIFATLVFLGAHFLYHRPLWQSVTFGLVVAVGAHLLDKHLP